MNDTLEPVEKLLPWRRPFTGMPGSRHESDSIFTPVKTRAGVSTTPGRQGQRTAVHEALQQQNAVSCRSILLSYLMLKPAAERLLSVVNNRKSTLDVEIRK